MAGTTKAPRSRRDSSDGPSLTDLPNLGKETARLLLAAGIKTPGDLRRIGAVAAALSIRRLRPSDPPCRSMLAGLEGALRGVPWHTIPKPQREKLWQEYERRSVEIGGGQ